ncbi:hypothetical protein CPB85DRAFT_262818 [Mucidula mucida]|nr:hypothetical protein CPB85DRAFT_262818 [Mucidula mucida]
MTSLAGSTSPHEEGHYRQPNSTPASYHKPRPKLSKDGTKVLKTFFATVSQHPTTAQKHELLEQILALEGNEHYDLEKISFWFQRQTWTNRPTKHIKYAETRPRLSYAGLKF